MADHLKPTVTSTYSNFVSELDARFDDLAVGLDPAVTSVTNVFTNSIRWSSASNKWQKFNGTSWADLTSTFSISISGNAGTVTNGVYTTGSYANPSWITSLVGSKISGDIAGNSGSATQLATARNINGVAFNGTSAISINLNNNATFNNAGAGAASGSTFNGGTALTVSYNTLGAPSTSGTGASGTWGISISGNAATVTNGVYNNSGTYGINITGNAATATSATSATNATSASSAGIASQVTVNYSNDSNSTYQMLWGSGNSVYGTAGIYCNPAIDTIYVTEVQATSDERLKTNWRNLPDDFVKRLSTVKSGIYDRVDIPKTQAGSSAQDWQKLLPEVVSENEGGMLSLAYANAALVSVIELAKEIQMLKEKIKQLENK